ncbi:MULTISPECIES: hypothetical protein [unclassified Thiocapsa]|uniref:hypothetical protein n=1 Tax=unclassified Thiocapsa TaxID=2641286 RepID=UPI0035B17FA0
MSTHPLILENDAISELALDVTKAVLARTEEARSIMEDEAGPIALAQALSDFFQLAGALEVGAARLEQEELNEFCAYGLDLHDRLAFLVRKVEIMDKRDTVARMFASLGVWVARRGAIIDNLQGTADGFGIIVNGTSGADDLSALCELMEEVIEAASLRLQLDEDRGDAWRPWRVINLNAGIAATRSLDPEVMERTFKKMSRRLPYDMPGFLADGMRQAMFQNVPDEVKAVIRNYMEKWPTNAPH